MTEAELLAEVVDLCEQLGLLYHHCPVTTKCRGGRGFPDLVIVGRGGVIFAELKSDDGETTAEQDLWRWTLLEAKTEAWLLRPTDLEAGSIRGLLERLAE